MKRKSNAGKWINCKNCFRVFKARTWNQTHCCLECQKAYARDMYLARQRRVIETRAQKKQCEVCGYNRWKPCLEWHHVDPSTKEFSISNAGARSQEKVKMEIAKCVVLCCNCHQEVHRGMVTTIKKVDEIMFKRAKKVKKEA